MEVFIRIFSKKKMFWQYLRIVTVEYRLFKKIIYVMLDQKVYTIKRRALK